MIIFVYSSTYNIWNICDIGDTQEVLSQALGCLKALICAFSQNEVFPHACVETSGKVKERKTWGWNIEKDSQKVKERRTSSTRDRETGRLKCKYSQKTEREIDNEGYLPFIWIWVIYSVTFSLFLLPLVEFTVGLVWSIIVSLLFRTTFSLMLVIHVLELNFQEKKLGTLQLLTLRKPLWGLQT